MDNRSPPQSAMRVLFGAARGAVGRIATLGSARGTANACPAAAERKLSFETLSIAGNAEKDDRVDSRATGPAKVSVLRLKKGRSKQDTEVDAFLPNSSERPSAPEPQNGGGWKPAAPGCARLGQSSFVVKRQVDGSHSPFHGQGETRRDESAAFRNGSTRAPSPADRKEHAGENMNGDESKGIQESLCGASRSGGRARAGEEADGAACRGVQKTVSSTCASRAGRAAASENMNGAANKLAEPRSRGAGGCAGMTAKRGSSTCSTRVIDAVTGSSRGSDKDGDRTARKGSSVSLKKNAEESSDETDGVLEEGGADSKEKLERVEKDSKAPRKGGGGIMERMKSMYGGALDYVPQEWCRVCSSVKVTSDWKASIYGKRTLCFSCHTLVKQHNLILPRLEPVYPTGILPRRKKAEPGSRGKCVQLERGSDTDGEGSSKGKPEHGGRTTGVGKEKGSDTDGEGSSKGKAVKLRTESEINSEGSSHEKAKYGFDADEGESSKGKSVRKSTESDVKGWRFSESKFLGREKGTEPDGAESSGGKAVRKKLGSGADVRGCGNGKSVRKSKEFEVSGAWSTSKGKIDHQDVIARKRSKGEGAETELSGGEGEGMEVADYAKSKPVQAEVVSRKRRKRRETDSDGCQSWYATERCV